MWLIWDPTDLYNKVGLLLVFDFWWQETKKSKRTSDFPGSVHQNPEGTCPTQLVDQRVMADCSGGVWQTLPRRGWDVRASCQQFKRFCKGKAKEGWIATCMRSFGRGTSERGWYFPFQWLVKTMHGSKRMCQFRLCKHEAMHRLCQRVHKPLGFEFRWDLQAEGIESLPYWRGKCSVLTFVAEISKNSSEKCYGEHPRYLWSDSWSKIWSGCFSQNRFLPAALPWNLWSFWFWSCQDAKQHHPIIGVHGIIQVCQTNRSSPRWFVVVHHGQQQWDWAFIWFFLGYGSCL